MRKNFANPSYYHERASCNWSEDSQRLIMTPSSLAKSIYFYVQEIGYFKTWPPYFTERQNLASYLIVLSLGGGGRLLYDGKEYFPIPGELFLIDCQNYHYYEAFSPAGWEFLWVHFAGNSSAGYYKECTKKGSFIFSFPDFQRIEDLFRSLLDENKARHSGTEVRSSSLLTQILTEILSLSTSVSVGDPYQSETVQKAVDYIERHFNEKLSLDILAAVSLCDKFHLAREFKNYMGVSVNEYLIQTRINYAKEKLKYSDTPVAHIAERAGISYVSHFINLFKAREGITPLAYRKAWQSKNYAWKNIAEQRRESEIALSQ